MTTTKKISKLTTGFYKPPHLWGDRDFFGHGPKVTITVKLEIEDENRIIANCYMDAREVGGDTRARGRSEVTIYVAPKGVKIKKIVSDTYSRVDYIDKDHEEDRLVPGEGYDEVTSSSRINSKDCVRFFRTVGDTDGDESGRRTGFEAFLNPVEIEITGKKYWEDYTTYISKVGKGPDFDHPGNNGCSGAAGAAFLKAYGITKSPSALHNEIRARGNLISSISGAAPAGVFRDALKRYVPDIILIEGQRFAYHNVRSLVKAGYPVIILQGRGSKSTCNYYAPSWDVMGIPDLDKAHWVVLNGIDYRSRTFSAIDNGSQVRLPFNYVYSVIHFRKEWTIDALGGVVGFHNRTYMHLPRKP